MHLRNRNKIQPPRHFDYDPNDNTPRMVNYREVREMSSELDQEFYTTPTKKPAQRKMTAYRGSVVRFNPYNPPAAPVSITLAGQTLPRPVQYDPGQLVRQYERENPEEAQARWFELQQLAAQRGFNHARYSIFKHAATDQAVLPSESASPFTASTRFKYQPADMVSCAGAGPNRPSRPALAARPSSTQHVVREMLKRSTKFTEEEIFIKEMETSDEDEPERAPATSTQARRARDFRPSWEDIGAALQLDIVYEVATICNHNQDRIMQTLKLTPAEQARLGKLLDQNTNRLKRERQNSDLLIEETQNRLLHGRGVLTQDTFRGMLDQTIFSTIGEEAYTTCTSDHLRKAKDYLRYCGLNPSMLDWVHGALSITSAISRRTPSTNLAAIPSLPHSSMINTPGNAVSEVRHTSKAWSSKRHADGAPDSPSPRSRIPYPETLLNRNVQGQQDHPLQSIENHANGTPSPCGRAFAPGTVPQQTRNRPFPTAFAQRPSSSTTVKGVLRSRPQGHCAESEIAPEHQRAAEHRLVHPQINTATSIPINLPSQNPRRDEAAGECSAHRSPSSKKRPARELSSSSKDGESAQKKRYNYDLDPKSLDPSGFPKDSLVNKTPNGPLNLAGFPQKPTKNMTINGPVWPPAPVQHGLCMSKAGGIMPMMYTHDTQSSTTNTHNLPASPNQSLTKAPMNGEWGTTTQVAAAVLSQGVNE